MYRRIATQLAFRAMTGGMLAAQLVSVRQRAPSEEPRSLAGSWLIANSDGIVTAHRGQDSGGTLWLLADAIVPNSAGAVQSPTLNGYYRARPDAYHDQVVKHEAALQHLRQRHALAVTAGHVYGEMEIYPDLLVLLKAAVGDRSVQLIFADWLEEHGFPHVEELRSKRRDKGRLTANQLLDLLTKPLDCKRRSFRGSTIQHQ